MEKDTPRFTDYFYYKDGELYWKHNNKIAGSVNNTGYFNIKLNGNNYIKHKVIFALFNNNYYPDMVDHKDRDNQNNRIENLRECNKSQNEANTGPRKTNKVGYKNVAFHKAANKYRAYLKGKHLGLFETPEQAAMAYNKAAILEYGEFAFVNIIK